MRRSLVVLLLILPCIAGANPSFTIGSNHYETAFAYPHDILKWPNSAVFVLATPQTLPWQGHVTDLTKRPSPTYTSSYQEVEFAPPSGYEGKPEDVHSWMKVSSYVYKRRFTLGGLSTTDYGKFLIEVGNTSLDMDLAAEGVARASGDGTYHLVPFEGKTEGDRDDYDLKLVYANHLFGRPVGAKIHYTRKTSGEPGGHILFTREGTTYKVPHLTWGWAAQGCNHIFGYSSINADAFFQNSYTVFKGRQLDLQASFEHEGNYKSGIRYRSLREDGDNYKWEYDDGSEFDGDYYVDDLWKDRHTDRLLRGYSKVRFWEVGDLDAGVLFFLQYASRSDTEVNKVTESDPESQERESEVIIETNPWLNYEFKGGYLDFGLLLELSRTGLRNSQTRWNSYSRTDEEDVLWSTNPRIGWDSSSERFSKGSDVFFATGWEANSSIGVYKRLSALMRLTILRKYTWTEKEYGKSDLPDGAKSYRFTRTHTRNNYRNETWMTGSVGLAYGLGPIQTFLTIQLPLAYLIKINTKLEDRESVLFEHETREMWQVQEPTTARLLFVYALSR